MEAVRFGLGMPVMATRSRRRVASANARDWRRFGQGTECATEVRDVPACAVTAPFIRPLQAGRSGEVR